MKYIRKKKKSGVPYFMLHATFSRGFTILFAVLIGSLLLSLGLFISQLSRKEITLSIAGKNSEMAFFAADTGIECALYWDIRIGDVFPIAYIDDDPPPPISCNGDPNIQVSVLDITSVAATSTFTLNLTPSGCAIVVVGKTLAGSAIIESRGRNDCGSGPNPARVERALRVRY
ncbi:MAG: hypothetical protein Q7R64_01395 [bacterium]|nr:hypothetical protein [bacterium]